MAKEKADKSSKSSSIPDEFSDVDSLEISDDFKGAFDEDVIDFLQDSKLSESGYTVYVYRFLGGSGTPREQCIQLNNEIKSKHEIGLMFGSGRFEIQIVGTSTQGKRKSATRKFILHPHYDKLMEKEKGQAPGTPGPPQQTTVIQNTGIDQSIKIMKELITLMLPLMAVNKSTGDNFPSMMKDTYKIMNEAMMSNMLESTKFFSEFQRGVMDMKAQELEVEEEEAEDEVGGVQKMIEMITPLLNQLMPLILGKSPKAQGTVALLKSLPQFKDAIKNKDSLKKLIAYIDKSKGKDISNKLLKKLGLTRPK